MGHWRLDLQTQQVSWSKQTFRIHGIDPAEGPPPLDEAIAFYHPDDRAFVEETVAQAMQTGRPWTFERRIVRRTGEERLVRSRGIVEQDGAGRAHSIFGIFQDLTDERRLLDEVKSAERLASVATLAAGISHEINNPLQYMDTGLTVLEKLVDSLRSVSKSASVEEAVQVIADLRHGVSQVGRIVGDLRSVVRAPSRAPTDETVDLAQAVQAAVGMTRHDFVSELGVEVVVAPAATPPVSAPLPELIQVFLNLLTNALQATSVLPRATARVVVRTFTDAHGNAVAEVEDSGPGIDEALKERIFEPFFTTKPLGIGHGMGLHICRSVVRALGGDVSLRSRPGQTVFRVRLPPARTEPVEEVADTRPLVMIVDDDARIGRALSMMLRRQYRTLVLSSPQEALQTLLESPVDLLLTDIMMPGMTGWELSQKLLDAQPGMAERIILMSGAAPSKHRPAGLRDLPFLRKPFEVKELRELIAARLGVVSAGGSGR